VASFNRPNLTYRIETKKRPYERLLEFLRLRKGRSGIVYCHTRRQTESLAEKLRNEGYKVAPYHAGLETSVRTRTQERFLSDELQIVCATVAFGMGVNKPNIRFVVHYDLPKNIESYYQETGRAGRDGAPADCLMLFGQADVINHERRAKEKDTEHERAVALGALDSLVKFAESRRCRRKELLAYFGEVYSDAKCGACDNCVGSRETRRHGALAPSSGSPVDYDETLFQKLKAVRLRLARERKVAAFVIAHDSMLKAIAATRPLNREDLARTKGFGARKADQFGAELIAAVREHCGQV
jgi:RecQ family ATP-dependent DNA helicase